LRTGSGISTATNARSMPGMSHFLAQALGSVN